MSAPARDAGIGDHDAIATGEATSKLYRNWVLFLVFLLMVSNYLDRSIVRILSPPIKAEFGLSDAQIGVLNGLAFALLYVVLGVPIAHLAERRSRVNILSGALVIWSAMTFCTALAGSYVQLVAARIGVGIGEAGAAPAAQSLLADYFPARRRASALSIYSFGIALGTLLGGLIGGLVAEHWGWRAALKLVGVPGLVLAILLRVSVREPRRGGTDRVAPPQEVVSLRAGASLLFANRTFFHLVLGAGIANFAGNGLHSFESMYLIERFGVGLGQVGLVVGLLSGGSAAIGMLAGGFIGDGLAARDRRWYIWLSAAGFTIGAPLYVAALMQRTWLAAAVLWVLPGMFLFVYAAPVQAVIHNLTHARLRATAVSLYLLVTGGIGVGLGPVGCGLLADRLTAALYAGPGTFASACTPRALSAACVNASASGLQFTLIAVCLLFWWGAIHFVIAGRTVRADISRQLALNE